jgi:hypothetical protein
MTAVPLDPALPEMRTMLDAEAMGEVLRRTLPDAAPLDGVTGRSLRYKPERSLVVRYDVSIGGRRHVATAMIAKSDLEHRARKPQNLTLAEMVDGRSPAPFPLHYDRELGALIQWFPLDVSVPALTRNPAELVERLSERGADIEQPPAEPMLLAYKPRRRAVLAIAGHVIKLYAREARFAAAVRGLRVSATLPSVRAPRCRAVWPDLLATAQTREPGAPATRSEESGARAGAVIAGVHAGSSEGLPAATPARQLESAAASARLVARIAPALAVRVDRLLAEFERTRPDHLRLVTSHGDFYPKQLLVDPRGNLVLTDFDELCVAPAALDIATYASYIWRRSPGQANGAQRAIDALLEGYGERPEGLPWYMATMMLRRAAHPFRRFDPDWPERVQAIVGAAEAGLHA